MPYDHAQEISDASAANLETLDDVCERRPKYPHAFIACSDRLCGADDCPNCHPENFRRGLYIGD